MTYVLWIDDVYTERANAFAEYLKTEKTNNHYLIGDYLGYSKEDIEFFVNKLKQKHLNK